MAEEARAMPLLLGGRYRCDRLLKSGSGIETFAGVDLEDQTPIIVKRVIDATTMERACVRLAHEAEVLRRLESASFPPPITTGREDGSFYLVRPMVDGVALDVRLATGPLSVASALRVATTLLDALQLAHDHRVLHRDLKPANVIVDASDPVNRAVLIDFGLARSPTLDSSVRDERVGTARYLAPEAAGVLEREVDERSDLYSFGVVLFECIAGRPPFEGDDVGSLLRQHLNTAPPSVREARPDVPRALDAVVQRLLRKDPAERYQSAGAVLADLRAIDEALARGVPDPVVVVGAHDNRPVLTEPAFVGRTAELALLSHTVEYATAGDGGVLLLEAESGGGKSRLLDEVALRVGSSAWVLRGQGVDQGAQRPFQVLEGLVHEINAAAKANPSIAAAIRAAVGDRADAAVAALPALAATLEIDDHVNLGPEAYGETRSIAALSVLLHALGETGRPAVVLLDDCQWADASTLKLLAQWPSDLPCRTVVIAAFRTEEVALNHSLRRGRPIAHVQLQAFGEADVESLAESMAGTLPRAAIEAVAALSEGSPFMAAAVLRGLVESGALVHEGRGWRVDPARLADVQTSRRAALFLVRRLELLSPTTLELLTVGAVLGKEFDAYLAAELCGQDPDIMRAALDEAAQRRIVWPEEVTGHARFLHDKLREALLSRLGPDERAGLHLRAAARIEEIDPDRIFELAFHFDAARRDDLALPYALRAAESARAQHSLDVALTNYRIAAGALRDDADGARAEVAEAIGDVLTLDGAYDEATEKLTSALEHASTADRRAALMGKLGEVAFKKGDQRCARAHLEAAVRELGGRLPRHSVTLLCALVLEVIVQTAHTVAPRLFLHRRKLAGSERRFLLARLYSRLAYCYWFNAGKVACMWAHLREMNILECYPPTAELAQAYSEHAPAMTIAPWFSRGIRYVEKSLRIRTDLGDLWGQGQSLNFYGVVLYAASRYREAIEKLDEAYRLLDQTGDRWEANVAMWNKAYALYRLGELSESVRVGRRLHETATAMGDMTAAGGGLSAWSRASNGQVPEALLRTQLDYGLGDAQTDTEVNVAEGLRRMAHGDHGGAVNAIDQAASIVGAANLRQEYIAHVQPWLATALREQAEAAPEWDLVERRDALRRGRKAARSSVRLAFFFRNNYPHALREAALFAAMGGRRRKAQRLMARSLAVAESQGAACERLLTLRAWAAMGLPVMGAPAAVTREAAEAELSLLVPQLSSVEGEETAAPAASLSLLDRFSALLAAGREIAAASTADAVLTAVQSASVALLRGDQCDVMRVTDGAGDALFEGEGRRNVSRMMVRRAIEGRSVVAMSAIDDEVIDGSDSIELSGVRSALCAPILSGGDVLAVLYVSHAGFGGLFGDDEVTIAEFIATLAGAALEHVANTEAELRKMFDDLTVTSSLLEATLDATIDGILVVDREGRMTSYNQRFGEMWGIPRDVLSSRNDKEAIRYVLDRLVDPAAFVAKIEELYADVSAESYDTLDFKDGRVFERGSKPQRIGVEVVGRVWSFRDVTERVRVEQALAVARDKAMEASRLKSEFVATTSHEIRTPMNGVIGLTGLLLETELDDVQREYAEAVRLSAEALLGVINDILDFSKIEAGKLELEDVDFGLAAALDDVASLVARGAAVKRLELQWHCDADVPAGLRGDVGRLRQILLNLVANAVKFTERGAVRVHVAKAGVSNRDPSRVRVRFEVIDTGVGLAPEDRDRLFEPFSQADASTTRRFGGTGLGLAICSRLANAMGGNIGVKSELGVGSTFWIEIPFTAVDAPAGRVDGRLTPPAPLHQLGQPGITGRVLVAEDNAINQLVAKEMIRRLGYECDVVGNGAEALEALRLRRYAAVLMDCYMPEMDGFAATRELRARERADGGLRTPVIAMTALAMAEDRDRCTQAGMDDYVSKPVNLAALGSTLERWISNRTAATA